MLQRAPGSTPFPYTTLFRSPHGSVQDPEGRARHVAEPVLPRAVLRVQRADHPVAGDRKSTRLNSSHVEISYAVFCLKKNMITPSSSRWSQVLACVLSSVFRT